VLIGAANTLVSYGFYALGLAIGFRYELASLIALVLGIIVSFVTQGRLVFLTRLRNRFPLFLATWAILYLVNITVIRVLNWAGLDLYLAGLAAIVPVTGIAFLLQKNIVFAEPRPAAMRVVLIGLLLLLAAARLDLVVRFEVNWDEFLNLAMVHSLARGELREVLQTAFVHLFFWVPGVAVNEVDQIIAARLFVMLVACLTSVAIYRTSRNFVGISAALFAVLAFNSFSFVIRHGNSLRTDPLAACCLMVAIWLALVRDFTIRRSVAVGTLVGLAGALTIKSFFYVPTVGAILLLHIWYGADRKSAIWLVGLSALTALASFVAVVALHSSSFPATASASAFIARTSGATVLSGDYSIVLGSLLQAIARNFFFWIVLLIGVLCAGGMLRYPSHRRKGLTLLSLTLTLASLIVYRDAYPYYYPFMLAPVTVVVGFGFERISNLRNGLYAWAAIALVLVSATSTYWQSRGQDNSGQRRVLGLVHQLFPHPVPYIDHTSMVSSYPKQGFFMSRWGVTDYRRTQTPTMNDIIARNEPRFLLVTRALLDVERLNPQDAGRRPHSLLTADIDVLRKNYTRYWGPIYLPGFQVKGSGDRQVQIPGDYIVQSTNPVLVDGRSILPGATIKLAKGNHRIVSNTSASFSWAAPAPPAENPPRQLFRGF
jgi:putative flippase GtrA